MTERQARFVEAYFTLGSGWLCATQAARIAGYACPHKQGPRMMSFPHVKVVVERRFRDLLARDCM